MEKENYILFNTTHTAISLSIPPEPNVIIELGNGMSRRRYTSCLIPVKILPQTSVDLVEKTGMSKKHLENCAEIQNFVKGFRAGYLKEVSQIIKDFEERFDETPVRSEIAEEKCACENIEDLPELDPMIEDEIENELDIIDLEYGILIEDEIEETFFEELVEGIEETVEEKDESKESEKKEPVKKEKKKGKRGPGRPRKIDKKRRNR